MSEDRLKSYEELTPKKIKESFEKEKRERRAGKMEYWNEALIKSFEKFLRNKVIASSKEDFPNPFTQIRAWRVVASPGYSLGKMVSLEVAFIPFYVKKKGNDFYAENYYLEHDYTDLEKNSYIELRFGKKLEEPKIFEWIEVQQSFYDWNFYYRANTVIEADFSSSDKKIYEGIMKQWKNWKKQEGIR